MNQLAMGIRRFAEDEQGVTMVEYGLIAALISIVALTALTGIGASIKNAFYQICTALNTAVGGTVACGTA